MTETTANAIDLMPEMLLHPSEVLMALIVALLAPMFLGVSSGDINLARLAAIETVSAYRASNQADLIAVAQIIAFGLAALGSLSLSLEDDVSMPMALRLRGNANACHRSAEQNRRSLAANQASNTLPKQSRVQSENAASSNRAAATPKRDTFLDAAAQQLLAAEAKARLEPTTQGRSAPSRAQAATPAQTGKSHQEMWAIAMANEASEINANLPNLPPAERKAAAMRASLLSSTAHDLIYGAPVPPFDPKTLTGITNLDAGSKQSPPA